MILSKFCYIGVGDEVEACGFECLLAGGVVLNTKHNIGVLLGASNKGVEILHIYMSLIKNVERRP